MPLSRQQKETLVEEYLGGVVEAPNVFLVDFEGISVPQVTELRNRVRESGGYYAVVKNRLVLRAIGGAALEELSEHFRGATAAAWSADSPVELAKALTEFAKEVPALEFKAGLVDGRRVAAAEISEIAALPSRQELIAKLVFLLQSPLVRLTRSLSELRRGVVVVLGQIAEKKGS